MKKSFPKVVAVLCSFHLTGCIALGPVDRVYELPELLIECEVVDSQGEAVGEAGFELSYSREFTKKYAIPDLVSEDSRSPVGASNRIRVSTNAEGKFSHSFPPEMRIWGSPVIIVPLPPYKHSIRSRFLALKRAGDSTDTYVIWLQGRKGIFRFVGPEAELLPVSEGSAVKGFTLEVSRSTDLDHIDLVLIMQQEEIASGAPAIRDLLEL